MAKEQEPEQVVLRDSTPDTGPKNAKERFYEKLRIPLKTLDIIIGVLMVALVAALIIGAVKGNS